MWTRCLGASCWLAACGGGHHSAGDASTSPIVVPDLTFAVIGDTRPPIPEDTGGYPTAIITRIFQDIAAETPMPQFVIATGDYMFTFGGAAQQMADIYMTARKSYPGPLYPAMGNHECYELTDINCAPSPTTNTTVFINTMLSPIQQTQLYYSESFAAPDGSWTANFTFIACNAWDATQATWLQSALAEPATYHFPVRHVNVADLSMSPCMDSQPIVDANPLTLFLTSHVHEYQHNAQNKELINGLGGAMLTSGTQYGYTLITRNSDGTLTVTTKDYMTLAPIDSFTIDANGSGA
jgi:hypothetical protein